MLRAWWPTISMFPYLSNWVTRLPHLQLPLLHKDLFSSGLRKRSGVLLYGPPGTGKVSPIAANFYKISQFTISLVNEKGKKLLYNFLILNLSDFTGKSCSNRMFLKFSKCKRAWIDQHVHRRVGEKCPWHFPEGKDPFFLSNLCPFNVCMTFFSELIVFTFTHKFSKYMFFSGKVSTPLCNILWRTWFSCTSSWCLRRFWWCNG